MGPRNYAGQSASERAAARRTALLEAALDLVGEDGWAPLSIEAICRRAGLNKRYFYESFAGLDAAMAALVEDVSAAQLQACIDALPEHGGPDVAVRAVVRTMCGHLHADRRRARVLLEPAPPGGAAADAQAAGTHRAVILSAARARTVFGRGDETAFALPASMTVGGTARVILDWLDGTIDCSADELADGLVAMWLAIGNAGR